jgi:hypothetical protein
VTLLLFLVGALSVYLQVYRNSLLNWICHEDGLLEYSQALLFLAAAVLFASAAVPNGRAGVFLWGLALINLFAAGEEISWGQRLFGIETPGWLDQVNVQHELSLHNIEGLQGNHRWLGLLFLFGICFLLPLCDALFAPCTRLFRRLRIPIFPLWAVGIFVMAVLFMAISRWVTGTVVINMDEMGEFYVATAFFVWGHAEAFTAAYVARTSHQQQPRFSACGLEREIATRPVHFAGRKKNSPDGIKPTRPNCSVPIPSD